MLRARAVARRFGTQVALEPTDVDVNAGEALALIGPNGAGKSTLLALLAGALEPSAGTIERVDEVQVGWVPQRTAFYDRLTALIHRAIGVKRDAFHAGRRQLARQLVGADLRPRENQHRSFRPAQMLDQPFGFLS